MKTRPSDQKSVPAQTAIRHSRPTARHAINQCLTTNNQRPATAAIKVQVEDLSSSDKTINTEYTNALVPAAGSVIINATPAPSLLTPNHGKLKAPKGTKINPIRVLLAPQPRKLLTNTIDISKSMLDLSQKIRQRESNYSRFNEQVVK